MARKREDDEYLSSSHLEVAQIYRENNAICEFLIQQCSKSDKPFRLPDHERAMLQVMWLYHYVYIVAARRAGKTHAIGNLFAALGGLLTGIPQTLTFGAVSGSMRQVGYIFDELIKTVDASEYLQSITKYGPKLSKDSYIWELKGWKTGDGTVYPGHTFVGLPLGSSKGSQNLRGGGTTGLFLDEFTLVPESSYPALLPIGATSRDPMEDVERMKLKKTDVWEPPTFDPTHERLIFCSTGDYDFVPAHKIFSQYRISTSINKYSNELLKALNYRYPNKRDEKLFHSLSEKILSLLDTELQLYYSSILSDKITSLKVIEFMDYLRSYWHGYQYMCIQLPMDALPEGWYRKTYLDTILPMMSEVEVSQEFFAKWTSDSSGVFRASTLYKATDESLGVELVGDDLHDYILGVDCGENRKMGVVILKIIDHPDGTHTVEVVYARQHDITSEKLTHPNQVRLLYSLLNKFRRTIGLVLDRGGGGVAVAATMAEQVEPYGEIWEEFGQPVLTIGEENEDKEGKEIAHLVSMDNKTVYETNSQLLAALQSGRFRFAGKIPNVSGEMPDMQALIDDEEVVYNGIKILKSQMMKLIVKPVAGTAVKIDLPSKPTDATHIHDIN